LGDARTRDALPGRDSGLVELGIVFHLLAPRLCQQKRMHAQFLRLRPLLGREGEILQDVGREGERPNDERSGAPSGKWDAEGQAEVPAGSDFSRACGATPSIRCPNFLDH
jgi:hypothetical protein